VAEEAAAAHAAAVARALSPSLASAASPALFHSSKEFVAVAILLATQRVWHGPFFALFRRLYPRLQPYTDRQTMRHLLLVNAALRHLSPFPNLAVGSFETMAVKRDAAPRRGAGERRPRSRADDPDLPAPRFIDPDQGVGRCAAPGSNLLVRDPCNSFLRLDVAGWSRPLGLTLRASLDRVLAASPTLAEALGGPPVSPLVLTEEEWAEHSRVLILRRRRPDGSLLPRVIGVGSYASLEFAWPQHRIALRVLPKEALRANGVDATALLDTHVAMAAGWRIHVFPFFELKRAAGQSEEEHAAACDALVRDALTALVLGDSSSHAATNAAETSEALPVNLDAAAAAEHADTVPAAPETAGLDGSWEAAGEAASDEHVLAAAAEAMPAALADDAASPSAAVQLDTDAVLTDEAPPAVPPAAPSPGGGSLVGAPLPVADEAHARALRANPRAAASARAGGHRPAASAPVSSQHAPTTALMPEPVHAAAAGKPPSRAAPAASSVAAQSFPRGNAGSTSVRSSEATSVVRAASPGHANTITVSAAGGPQSPAHVWGVGQAGPSEATDHIDDEGARRGDAAVEVVIASHGGLVQGAGTSGAEQGHSLAPASGLQRHDGADSEETATALSKTASQLWVAPSPTLLHPTRKRRLTMPADLPPSIRLAWQKLERISGETVQLGHRVSAGFESALVSPVEGLRLWRAELDELQHLAAEAQMLWIGTLRFHFEARDDEGGSVRMRTPGSIQKVAVSLAVLRASHESMDHSGAPCSLERILAWSPAAGEPLHCSPATRRAYIVGVLSGLHQLADAAVGLERGIDDAFLRVASARVHMQEAASQLGDAGAVCTNAGSFAELVVAHDDDLQQLR
jgi:hypothetical protein